MANETNNNALVMTKAIGDMSQAVTKLATIVDFLSKDIAEIKSDVKGLSGVYATQAFVAEADAALEQRIVKIENASIIQKWVSPLVSGVGATIVTFLAIFYLTHLK